MIVDLDTFLRATVTGGPAVALTADPVAAHLRPGIEHGIVVRRLDGSAMRTLDGMYAQYARAWDFPGYFWHGGDSFNDCIGDLDDGRHHTATGARAAGFLTVVTHGGDFLADADPDDFTWIARAQDEWREQYATVDAYGADRPVPVEFGLLLQTAAADLELVRRRWSAAGARITEVGGPA